MLRRLSLCGEAERAVLVTIFLRTGSLFTRNYPRRHAGMITGGASSATGSV